jgi:hypothetical protein
MRHKYLAHLFVWSLLLVFICGCHKKPPPLDTDVATKACVHNLEVIADGKRYWAGDHQKGPEDTPTWEELSDYTRRKPACPGGGTYTIGKVGDLPSCSIADHQTAFVKSKQAGSTNASP